MKNEFNEENLNYLSEAISNVISDESDSADELRHAHNNPVFQSPSYLQNKSNYSKMKVSKNDDLNTLRFKIKEMNKLMEQNSKLMAQQDEKNRELEATLIANKKLIQNKFTKYDKLKKEFKSKVDRINELEAENNYLKFEMMKLHEDTKFRDNSVNEIQSVIKVTTTKFKTLEEKNQILKDENDRLKREISELKNNNSNLSFHMENLSNKHLTELKNLKQNYESALMDLKQEMSKKEENLKVKFDESEKTYKAKVSKREDDLKNDYINEISKISMNFEETRIENEKLKIEINRLHETIEEMNSILTEKTNEFKKNIDLKEKNYDKLFRSLKDVQKEAKEIENKYNAKANDWQGKFKNCEENESKLKAELVKREKLIGELENEIYRMKQALEEYESSIKEMSIKLENKEGIVEELKNQNTEIINEFNKKINEFEEFQKEKQRENEELNQQLKEFYDEKKLNENEELRKELEFANSRLKELTDMIEEKNRGFEEIQGKDRQSKENLERNNKALIRKLREIEEKYQAEIINLNNNLKIFEREFNVRKDKYENKIQKLKIKLDEETSAKENLMKEVKLLIENKMSYDRVPIKLKSDNYVGNFKPYKQAGNFDATQMLETLKEINMKIDEKI